MNGHSLGSWVVRVAAVGADLMMGDSSVTPYQQSGSAVVEEH